MESFLDQLMYVRKVIKSCITEDQLEGAKQWAQAWSSRMRKQYPKLVPCEAELYEAVTA
jgi:hypothetical protein